MRKLYIFGLIGLACIIVALGCASDSGPSRALTRPPPRFVPAYPSPRAAAESARIAEMKAAGASALEIRQALASMRRQHRPTRPGAGRPLRVGVRLTAEEREQRSAMIAEMVAEGASPLEIRQATARIVRQRPTLEPAQRRPGEQ